jgi:hypothetical protein
LSKLPRHPSPVALEALLGSRGFGHLFKPRYSAKTPCPGPTEPKGAGWLCLHCKAKGNGPNSHRELRESALYWFKWSHNGQRFKESTKTSDLEAAEEYRRNRLMEMWGGRLPWEKRAEPTLHDVLQRGIVKAETKGRRSVHSMKLAAARLMGKPDKTKKKPSKRLRELWERMEAVKLCGGGPTLASNITEAGIDAYIAGRQAQGYEPATIKQDLSMLRRAFRVAYRTIDGQGRRMVERIPHIEMPEVDNVRQGMPSEAEHQAIKKHLRWCLPNLADFYRITGYRRKEPLSLQWALHVDRERGRITIDPKNTKSRKWRGDWPYEKHPVLKRVMEEQWALKEKVERERERIVTHVFFWEDGRPIKDFRAAWTDATTAAGLPNRLIHDYRRMAYSEMIRTRKIDPKTARRLIGAKTPSIGDRYHIINDDDEAAAAEALGQFHESQGPSPQRVLPFTEKKTG